MANLLLLLTGARRDEIAEARWNEIDLTAKTLTIAKERSKNGVAHEIPLSDTAIDILALSAADWRQERRIDFHDDRPNGRERFQQGESGDR